MAAKARAYITGFTWSLPVARAWFVHGVGGVVALFLFEFDGAIAGTDDRLWVVAGNLPGAYMTVGPENAKEALEAYCILMDDWIEAVLDSRDFEDVFPVDAAATQANADDLARRIAFLREEIIPTAPMDPVVEILA